VFTRMRCQSFFFPECTANHVFPRMCYQSCFPPEFAVDYVFFSECAANHVFPHNFLPIIHFFP
jgi:hypothetical protein